MGNPFFVFFLSMLIFDNVRSMVWNALCLCSTRSNSKDKSEMLQNKKIIVIVNCGGQVVHWVD